MGEIVEAAIDRLTDAILLAGTEINPLWAALKTGASPSSMPPGAGTGKGRKYLEGRDGHNDRGSRAGEEPGSAPGETPTLQRTKALPLR